jgi:hypothetical protein
MEKLNDMSDIEAIYAKKPSTTTPGALTPTIYIRSYWNPFTKLPHQGLTLIVLTTQTHSHNSLLQRMRELPFAVTSTAQGAVHLAIVFFDMRVIAGSTGGKRVLYLTQGTFIAPKGTIHND